MKTSKLNVTERVGAWIAIGGVGLCLFAISLFVFTYGFVDMNGTVGWFLVQTAFHRIQAYYGWCHCAFCHGSCFYSTRWRLRLRADPFWRMKTPKLTC